MRNSALLLGIIATACSIDHVVVAALDGAAGNNLGGAPGGAGSANLSANAGGGVLNAGGTRSEVNPGVMLTSGGGNVDMPIGGDAGTSNVTVCACVGDQAQLCGTDGVTYTRSCGDAGTCELPTVACWHACPCLEGESANTDMAIWFPQDCQPDARCSDGFTCVTVPRTDDLFTLCVPADN